MTFCSSMRLFPCHLNAESLFRLTIAFLLCALLAACSKDSGNASNSESIPQVALVPALTIGSETSPDGVLFGRVDDLVAVNSTGSIYIGDRQASTIYAFTAQGELIDEIGQKGEGTSEFALLSQIRIGPGDTLYASDSRAQYTQIRISAFEPTAHSLAYDFTVSVDSMGFRPGQLVGVVDTGFLISWSERPSFEDGTGLTELYVYAQYVDWAGLRVQNPLVRLPGKSWLAADTGSEFVISVIPFGPEPFIQFGPGGHVYSGLNASVDVTMTTASGVPIGSITHELEAIPLTSAELEEHLEGLFSDSAQRLRPFTPKAKPAYSSLLVDDEGRIWVRLTPADYKADTSSWLILDTESRVRGQVTLPSSMSLEVIAAGRAYATNSADGLTLEVFDILE